MGYTVKSPYAETCDLGRAKINKKGVYETLRRSIIISAIEAVDGKMSMLAEMYESCVHACVVMRGKRGAVWFRFLHSEYKHVPC